MRLCTSHRRPNSPRCPGRFPPGHTRAGLSCIRPSPSLTNCTLSRRSGRCSRATTAGSCSGRRSETQRRHGPRPAARVLCGQRGLFALEPTAEVFRSTLHPRRAVADAPCITCAQSAQSALATAPATAARCAPWLRPRPNASEPHRSGARLGHVVCRLCEPRTWRLFDDSLEERKCTRWEWQIQHCPTTASKQNNNQPPALQPLTITSHRITAQHSPAQHSPAQHSPEARNTTERSKPREGPRGRTGQRRNKQINKKKTNKLACSNELLAGPAPCSGCLGQGGRPETPARSSPEAWQLPRLRSRTAATRPGRAE